MSLLTESISATTLTAYVPRIPDDPNRRDAERFALACRPRFDRQVAVRALDNGPARWLAEYLENSLNELLDLPEGWDGEGAEPVALEAATGAVEVMAALIGEAMVAPFVFPLPDGGLQLEWHAGEESIEIEIDKDGCVHVLETDRSGTIVFNEELAERYPPFLSGARRTVESISRRILGIR
jgi:hypothetical protein